MAEIILTDEQTQLLDILTHWYKYDTKIKPYFSYSGGPGVGKSTVIKTFIENLGLGYEEVACAAYVGKAVLVLLRNNLKATTIHSLIYNTYPEVIKPNIDDPDQKVKIKLKTVLKTSLDPNIKLIVIDEATMVNDKMRDEILSFGIPTIFIGDINQLPPVFGISSVMLKPDFKLTKIMRQAENDPIVQICQAILQNRDIPYGTYGLSKVVDHYDFNEKLLTDFDIIICAKNKTREMLNTNIRKEILHIDSKYPVIGDKLICTQNNWDVCTNGIFPTNGLIGYVENIDNSKIYKGYSLIDFRPDFMTDSFDNIELDRKFISLSYEDKKEYGISKYNKFDYGYVITAHKSQGSEADNVLFIDENFWDKELSKKMRYTAVSRARKSITYVKVPSYNRKYY